MLGSNCDLKTRVSEMWGIASPYKSGAQNHLFSTLTAYNFETKHDIDDQAMRWQIKGISYIVSKCPELWSTNALKLDRHYDSPYVKSAL